MLPRSLISSTLSDKYGWYFSQYDKSETHKRRHQVVFAISKKGTISFATVSSCLSPTRDLAQKRYWRYIQNLSRKCRDIGRTERKRTLHSSSRWKALEEIGNAIGDIAWDIRTKTRDDAGQIVCQAALFQLIRRAGGRGLCCYSCRVLIRGRYRFRFCWGWRGRRGRSQNIGSIEECQEGCLGEKHYISGLGNEEDRWWLGITRKVG